MRVELWGGSNKETGSSEVNRCGDLGGLGGSRGSGNRWGWDPFCETKREKSEKEGRRLVTKKARKLIWENEERWKKV